MAFDKITQADLTGKGVIGLPDTPQLPTMQMQQKLDEIALDVIVPKFNDVVDKLNDPAGADDTQVTDPTTGLAGSLNDALQNIEDENAMNTLNRHNHANLGTLDAITAETKDDYDRLVTLLGAITAIQNVLSGATDEIPTGKATSDAIQTVQDEVDLNTLARHTHSNKSVLDSITAAVKGKYDSLVTLFTGITAIDSSVTNSADKLPTSKAVKTKTDTMQTEITANTNARHTHSNKSVLDAISSSVKTGYDRLVTLFSSITGIATTVTNTHAKIPDCAAIVSYVSQLGGGDMLKSVYDADDNGIVDKAENAMTTVEQDDSLALAPTSAGNALPLTIYGQSTQNGTPTPSAPVAIESASADFKCVGKNLIPYPYVNTSQTINNVNFTDNGDGSISADNAASAITQFRLYGWTTGLSPLLLRKGTYILSGCPSGGGINSLILYLHSQDSSINIIDDGEGTQFTISDDTYVGIAIRVANGYDADGKTVYPMLRLESVEDATYEPYKHTDITTDLTLRAIEVSSTDPYNLVKDGKYYIADTIDWDEVDGYTLTKMVGHDTFTSCLSYSSAGSVRFGLNSLADTKYRYNVLSNIMTSGTSTVNEIRINSVGTEALAYSDFKSSTSDWNTWLSSNPVSVDYILATPTKTSLTSEQAKALLSMRTYDESTSIDAVNDPAPVLELEYAKTRTPALALTGHNMAHINAIDIGDM